MNGLRSFFGLSVYTTIAYRRRLALSILAFMVVLVGYGIVSRIRHVRNPDDKIVPNIAQLVSGVRYVLSPGENERMLLIEDSVASLQRLGVGVVASFGMSVIIGMSLALFPIVEAILFRFILYFGKVPPLAILPIVFIISGLGETTKIALIIIGITPTIILDVYFSVKRMPKEQFISALALGARTPTIIRRVVLPQIMPPALTSLRLQLLNAWIFLIAAEAIASSNGLGYRIFLVRRYLAMDVIIPYVLWIAALSFTFDALIAWWIAHRYPWYTR
ncbi:ABC transporter permease subunit [Candidatus Uhrbacteria bacterium]|nr:ABC transporter permease subunit [Candidatus Uhrbacteria bacterium]